MSENDTAQLSHEDALEALKNARKDAATQRTQKGNALNEVARLKAALTAAGLDPEADDLDTRAASLKDAGKAKEDAEAARLEADVYATALEEAGLDPEGLLSRLQKLPESASDDDLSAAIAEHVKPVKDAAGRALELERKVSLTEAATALGKPADALAEILEGKTLEKRTVKATDGSESEQWGIPQGDTFKPLSELRSIQLLGTAQPDKPAPAPLPTGQRGGNAKPTDPVQALNAALFGGPKEN